MHSSVHQHSCLFEKANKQSTHLTIFNARKRKACWCAQDGEDPFTRLEREKSERVSANKKRHAKNRESAAPAGATSIPATVKLSTKLDPASVRGQIAKGKAIKSELKQASYLAGVSTTSMGKFDSRLKGEGYNERKLPGSRKKILSVTGGTAEKDVAGKVLGKVIR